MGIVPIRLIGGNLIQDRQNLGLKRGMYDLQDQIYDRRHGLEDRLYDASEYRHRDVPQFRDDIEDRSSMSRPTNYYNVEEYRQRPDYEDQRYQEMLRYQQYYNLNGPRHQTEPMNNQINRGAEYSNAQKIQGYKNRKHNQRRNRNRNKRQ